MGEKPEGSSNFVGWVAGILGPIIVGVVVWHLTEGRSSKEQQPPPAQTSTHQQALPSAFVAPPPAPQQSAPSQFNYLQPSSQNRVERCCVVNQGNICHSWTATPERYAEKVRYAAFSSVCYCSGDVQGRVGRYCP